MSDRAQFSVGDEDGFYLIVADDITVYEAYDDAVADIRETLQEDVESFLATVCIEGNGTMDDIAVTLEQVSWPQIIRDMEPQQRADSPSSPSGVQSDGEN